MRERAARVPMMGLSPWRTALRNITMRLKIQKVPKAEAVERARHWIRLTGLSGFEDAYPAALSQGYRIWPSMDRAKGSDHPERFRLRRMERPGRAVLRRLRASFRKVARFSGALSFRLRARSSSKLMSSTQCRPFSIDQCARAAAR